MKWLNKLFNRNDAMNERDPNQSNAYDMIGGDKTIKAIAEHFYHYMATNANVRPLRDIHPQSLQDSEQKLYEFLSGWLGGPQLFQQRHGNPALRARHMPFAIDESMRDQWLECMGYALGKSLKSPEHQKVIFQAISTLADHMRNQPNQS
ncbi:group II truncated hemoglobin [Parashewanella tropica]|uniref:group II truncated hemoglobin n=1 Tax=Parashewanella tropica TaxID=2547970 RepID=UPI00105946DB|nr:group II truncated hemoglobin [Parashewanella tropica]